MSKRLIDELYDDQNYQECVECGEMHVCCPHCGLCLKYCHDADECFALGGYDPMDDPLEGFSGNQVRLGLEGDEDE